MRNSWRMRTKCSGELISDLCVWKRTDFPHPPKFAKLFYVLSLSSWKYHYELDYFIPMFINEDSKAEGKDSWVISQSKTINKPGSQAVIWVRILGKQRISS